MPATRAHAPREKRIESYFRRQCRLHGLLALKFVSPARNGVPDRMVITAVGTVFVELKRPGERPTRLQKAMHRKMRRFGAEVHVLDSVPVVDTFVRELCDRVEVHLSAATARGDDMRASG
jgi:hypothetical protein